MSLLGGQGSDFGPIMLAKYQLPFSTQEGPTHTHSGGSTYNQGFAFLESAANATSHVVFSTITTGTRLPSPS